MKIYHLSDLHLHTTNNGQVVTFCDRLIAKINHQDDQCALIITGDCTDDGTKAQYENFTALIGVPVHAVKLIIPGNHDYGPAGNFYKKDSAQLFDRTMGETIGQDPIRSKKTVITKLIRGKPDVLLIGVNSCTETGSPLDFACGEIGRLQLEYLNHVISSNRNRFIVVALHHHPFYVNPLMKLKDANAFMEVVYGRVDLLLFGHKHQTDTWCSTFNPKIMHCAPPPLCSVSVFTVNQYGVTHQFVTV